jgi:hypothetical protein
LRLKIKLIGNHLKTWIKCLGQKLIPLIPRPIWENGKRCGRFGNLGQGWVQRQRPHLGLMKRNKKTINEKACVFLTINLAINLSNVQKGFTKQ